MYKYTKNDLYLVSWNEIDKWVNEIYNDVLKYLNYNNLKIKYICPILRGGMIPACLLSHLFDVPDMLPIQLKYDNKKINIKIDLDYIKNIELSGNECILLVEGNHVTGNSASLAVNLIRNKFGNDVKIIYVSLTRDYFYRYSVKNVIYTSWAVVTNESKMLSIEECKKLNIDYNLVSIYPWENIEEELFELNN